MATSGVAVVLAAGSATRFGSDKRLASIDGKAMLHRSLEPYLKVIDQVCIVVRPNDDIGQHIPRNVRAIEAPSAHLGMGHSLATAANELKGVPWILVGLADMPWINSKTIRLVKARLESESNAIVRPTLQKEPGHPVGFTGNFLSSLSKLQGDAGAKYVVRENSEQVIDIEVNDAGILRDVDRPEQLISRA